MFGLETVIARNELAVELGSIHLADAVLGISRSNVVISLPRMKTPKKADLPSAPDELVVEDAVEVAG